jgi:hypothetical protein
MILIVSPRRWGPRAPGYFRRSRREICWGVWRSFRGSQKRDRGTDFLMVGAASRSGRPTEEISMVSVADDPLRKQDAGENATYLPRVTVNTVFPAGMVICRRVPAVSSNQSDELSPATSLPSADGTVALIVCAWMDIEACVPTMYPVSNSATPIPILRILACMSDFSRLPSFYTGRTSIST